MDELKINKILENLSLNDETDNADRRQAMLESLRVAVGSLNRAELIEELSNVSLESLFTCLATERSEQIEATIDIIKNFMLLLDPLECITKYSGPMLEGFHHPDIRVQGLGIALLNRFLEQGESAAQMLAENYQYLLVGVIKLISSEELSIANLAGEFLIKLSSFSSGSQFLLGSPGFDIFKGMMDEQSDAIKFRIYEIFAKMANKNPNNFLQLEAKHLLIEPLAKACFETSDPLGQMNSLEILSILTESDKGVAELEKLKIYELIKALAGDWQNNPMSGLILPGVLKFIAKLGVRSVPSEDLILLVVSSILDGNNFSLQTTGFESLCFIGTNPAGKAALRGLKNKGVDRCFTKVQVLLREAPMECRCRMIDSLTNLYLSELDKKDPEKTFANWFFLVFPEISELFSLVQQPFVEIRLAVLKYFSAICSYDWALQGFLRLAGVLEFLLDRNIEGDKDCAFAKFQICVFLSKSELAKRILSSDKISQLEVHVSQGPYYAPIQSQVATETP